MSENKKVESRNLDNDPIILEGKFPFKIIFTEDQFNLEYNNDPVLVLAAYKIAMDTLEKTLQQKKESGKYKPKDLLGDKQCLAKLAYYTEDIAVFIRDRAMKMSVQAEIRKPSQIKIVPAMAGLKTEKGK